MGRVIAVVVALLIVAGAGYLGYLQYQNLDAEKKAVAARADSLGKVVRSMSDDTLRLSGQTEELQRQIVVLGAEFQQKLAARDSALNALRDKVSDALLSFKESGLTVSIRDGRIYVSLSNKLLFASGSTDIDRRGKEALLKLSEVLNRQEQSDINILIEGHTDVQPIINVTVAKDNWDLSVLRSTEVVRYLTNDGKVDAKRLIASGRGEFYPVAEGRSESALARNRRTEIILTPNLEALFAIVRKK